MQCKFYAEDYETCINDKCPYCADFCPVVEHQEVCRFAKPVVVKCGSCVWGEACSWTSGGKLTYVHCRCPEKFFKKESKAVKQRTTKACLHYKQKDGGSDGRSEMDKDNN